MVWTIKPPQQFTSIYASQSLLFLRSRSRNSTSSALSNIFIASKDGKTAGFEASRMTLNTHIGLHWDSVISP